MRKLRLGDLVQEHEGRHIGRVVGLYGNLNSLETAQTVIVRWLDTGWRTEFHGHELSLFEARAESNIRA